MREAPTKAQSRRAGEFLWTILYGVNCSSKRYGVPATATINQPVSERRKRKKDRRKKGRTQKVCGLQQKMLFYFSKQLTHRLS